MSHSQCLGGNTRLRDSVNCFKETRAGNCCSPSGTVSSRPGLVGSLNDWIQHSASCKLMPNLHVIVQRFRLHVLSRPGQKFAFTFDIGAIYFLHLKCTAANFRTGSEFTYCIQRSKPNFPFYVPSAKIDVCHAQNDYYFHPKKTIRCPQRLDLQMTKSQCLFSNEI